MKITENKNKRARICKIGYACISDLVIINYPGSQIQITGDFKNIAFSVASFSEIMEANGEQYLQELIIEMKGNDPAVQKEISEITGKYCLVKLEYTNQEVKVIGSEESPVLLIHEQSGNPVINKLSVSRNSPEKAKYLIG